ncbi:malonyl-CoA decarboxylase [Rhizobium sp. SSA_523]|uniref:malonyl-CoA decarboxylase n=1 Tax=Rhizobium sp. SSA_523 TaxID=2952477 RepID=UPI0020905161|nr:malonyl-CoA decarboxylase [Rhizobium sp. SSA_523]MCO5731410.1 malonyl-CoA decarboxylase [Rhizobium sp. SSA_523]WKC22065.1 malonyl-CoA decarboxylase [Rhizobium sp. SSA_523]
MNTTSFLGDMLQSIADRGKRLFAAPKENPADPVKTMELQCEALLSSRGEASGMALARDIIERWQALNPEAQQTFLRLLVSRFGPNVERLEKAIARYQEAPAPATLLELHVAAEPLRQELIRRLNLAPGGTASLVRMRQSLLQMTKTVPELQALDADFSHLFASWFNRGFLMLKQINWSTPADILEKIIRYEAVHHIGSWEELRQRLAPEDRRCFAFFHPQLSDDPLIFVEVALTRHVPASIGEVLQDEREIVPAGEATTAVFYSISNCQEGLRGISFGNFLIKQVVEDLRRECPKLSTFVTLSPVPGLADWLARERHSEASDVLSGAEEEQLAAIDRPGWEDDADAVRQVQPLLTSLAAWYFLKARDRNGRVVDPVARFHLGNGARLERLNMMGDRSARALRQSHGLMVNYLYKLEDIEANHEAFAARGEVVAAPAVRRLAPDKPVRQLVPLQAGDGHAAETKTVQNSKEFSA